MPNLKWAVGVRHATVIAHQNHLSGKGSVMFAEQILQGQAVRQVKLANRSRDAISLLGKV